MGDLNHRQVCVDTHNAKCEILIAAKICSQSAAPPAVMSAMEPPPQVIRPQQALNERETIETEVISAFFVT